MEQALAIQVLNRNIYKLLNVQAQKTPDTIADTIAIAAPTR